MDIRLHLITIGSAHKADSLLAPLDRFREDQVVSACHPTVLGHHHPDGGLQVRHLSMVPRDHFHHKDLSVRLVSSNHLSKIIIKISPRWALKALLQLALQPIRKMF